MRLKLIRSIFNDKSTLGHLYVDDHLFSGVLEDRDRNLQSTQPLDEILAAKVPGETCIPYGTYSVIISFSVKFKRMMPEILGVPGFKGIRIHAGNSDVDTEGCLLIGTIEGDDWIGASQVKFGEFFPILQSGLGQGSVVIDIVKYDPEALLAAEGERH